MSDIDSIEAASRRLALALDALNAAARTRILETANREVAARIDRAIATVRGALGAED